MEAINFLAQPTVDTFDEQGYLFCNEDVRNAIIQGSFTSGKEHFISHGVQENRLQLNINLIRALKGEKICKIKHLLQPAQDLEQRLSGIPELSDACFYNFLDEDTKQDFNIIETDNISQNPYDKIALRLLDYYQDGNILDIGAGFRRFNYRNVVNYEIVKYISTDVVGVGEKLPFKDSVFDCIFSFSVLEHVKDPFACAKEMVRCLKSGGMLYVVVPHLQPYHGYPHHYYNMTHQGLANLFSNLDIRHQEVNGGNTAIWSISWMLRTWVENLPTHLAQKLLELQVSELISPTMEFRKQHAQLILSVPPEIQLQIACATSLVATKPDQGDLLADQSSHYHPALKEIMEVLRPQYITPENIELYNPDIPDRIDSFDDDKPETIKSPKSMAQKIEHVLRTTLHYFRLWKKEVIDFD
jgi:SAM-dependent methyltransferase